MVYLQVNALSEWIIGIYLHDFTNNKREISIPQEFGIENFEFIVSERVRVNPYDSPRPWCVDLAIARPIHQGLGLRFLCNDLTLG